MQVLLIEDDESLIRVLVPALQSHRYRVEVARSQALGGSMTSLKSYDLILLGVEILTLDQSNLCYQLRYGGNFTPILLFTVRDKNTKIILGLECGVDDYIIKPFNLEGLMERIDALMTRDRGFLKHFTLGTNHQDHDVDSDNSLMDQIRTIWDKTKDITFSYIQNFFQVLQCLEQGILEEDLRKNIERTAHKLSGSLGTFGFEEGSKIAKELEQSFAGVQDLKDCLEKVRPLILSLNQVIIATDYKLHLAKTIPQESLSLYNNNPPEITATDNFAPHVFPQSTLEKSIDLPTIDSHVSKTPLMTPFFDHQNSRLTLLKPEFEDSPIAEQYILLADGDQEFGSLILHDAISWKFGIKLAKSAEELFALVEGVCPTVILINLELLKKRPDWQKFKNWRNNFKIPLFVISNNLELEYRVQALELQVDIFLQKPVTSSQIFAAVVRAMNFHKHHPVKVMVLDDDQQVTQLLMMLLEGSHFHVEILNDPTRFWQVLNKIQPDLLVLDIEMPTLDGLQLCRMIRQDFQWSWLPILFLTGHDDIHTLQKAFAAGADDFISKPIDPNGFVNRVLNRWKRSQLYRDQMDTDLLTGISNRTGGSRSFSQLLQLAAQSHRPLCLVVLDLDHFKQVNDRYGHEEGDRVLREFGEFLKQNCRAEDVLARWGGEEFIVAMLGLTREAGVKRMNEIRHEWRSKAFTSANGEAFQVTFSGGVAQYPADGTDFQVLYRTADAALYKAKGAGRNLILPAL
jgi:diguanylate cyclase (GGDEF)-like protein